MDASVASFSQRLREPWLTCAAAQARIADAFARITKSLQVMPQQTLFVIAPDETELILAAVLATLATGHPAVLGNPQWTPAEALAARDLLGGQQTWLTSQHNAPTAAADSATASEGNTVEPANSTTTAADDTTEPTANTTTAPTAAPRPPHPHELHFSHLAVTTAYPSLRTHAHRSLAGYLLVPTGGTGGSLKLAYHNWQTLYAAIAGYARFWETDVLNCVCSLPVCHIGGLMPALRTFATGGRLCLLPWRQLQALACPASASEMTPKAEDATAQLERFPTAPRTETVAATQGQPLTTPHAPCVNRERVATLPDLHAIARDWQISLVPAQVQQLLGSTTATAWLRSMQAVLIGGGATRSDLLEAAAAAGIPLCPAYGMTETAATIALQRPVDFLRKSQDSEPAATPPTGEVLPHLSARTEPESGRILLSGESLFHGYFPAQPQASPEYATSDRGLITEETSQHALADGTHLQQIPPHSRQLLTVLGRLDNIIVSGGKKIDPALVEQAITAEAQRQGCPVRGLLVTSVADERWGQRLIVFIEIAATAQKNASASLLPAADRAMPEALHNMTEALRNGVRRHLPAYQIPKQWLCITALPLNERGKPDRQRIAELAGEPS